MNNLLTILSFLALSFLYCNAQYNEPSDFIPKGYVMYEKHFGDLNKDGQEDCVLIIKKTDSSNIIINRFDEVVDRNRRGIIVLFKNENSYQLADSNYNCFSSENEDGGVYYPPQLFFEFERGNLIVNYEHGRYGYWKYIFRFQKSSFKLIGYDSISSYGPVVNTETSINFLTKKKLVRKNINKEDDGGQEIFEETWSDIELDKLVNLSEIMDFDELEMYEY